jgi:Transmembrane protein 43
MSTETKTQGWFSRLSESIKGVLVGLLLFAISFPLLYMNEGRAVRQAEALKDGASAVVTISPDSVDEMKDGFLVHLTGPAQPHKTLVDSEFELYAHDALRLERTVEMYQWQEQKQEKKRKKAGGSEETTITYTYGKVWSKELIDSRQFKDEGYDNPTQMPYSSRTMDADDATVGAFQLGSLVGQLNNWSAFPVEMGEPKGEEAAETTQEAPVMVDDEPEPDDLEPATSGRRDPFRNRDKARAVRAQREQQRQLRQQQQQEEWEQRQREQERELQLTRQRQEVDASMRRAKLARFIPHEGGYYLGDNPSSPQLGDARIGFRVVPAGTVSLLAQQRGEGFVPYVTTNGGKLYRIIAGEQTAPEMFHQLKLENEQLTWILRGVGFLFMFLGLLTIFRPLVVVADVVPFFGSLLGAGVGIFSFLIAAPLTLVTIAVGWVAVRPILAGALICGALALFYMAFKVSRRHRK